MGAVAAPAPSTGQAGSQGASSRAAVAGGFPALLEAAAKVVQQAPGTAQGKRPNEPAHAGVHQGRGDGEPRVTQATAQVVTSAASAAVTGVVTATKAVTRTAPAPSNESSLRGALDGATKVAGAPSANLPANLPASGPPSAPPSAAHVPHGVAPAIVAAQSTPAAAGTREHAGPTTQISGRRPAQVPGATTTEPTSPVGGQAATKTRLPITPEALESATGPGAAPTTTTVRRPAASTSNGAADSPRSNGSTGKKSTAEVMARTAGLGRGDRVAGAAAGARRAMPPATGGPVGGTEPPKPVSTGRSGTKGDSGVLADVVRAPSQGRQGPRSTSLSPSHEAVVGAASTDRPSHAGAPRTGIPAPPGGGSSASQEVAADPVASAGTATATATGGPQARVAAALAKPEATKASALVAPAPPTTQPAKPPVPSAQAAPGQLATVAGQLGQGAATPTQAAPVPVPVSRQVSEAVTAHMAQLAPPVKAADGTWTLSVQLDPPQLGRVDAVVSFGASGLSVLLVPSAPVAQQVLQQASQHIAANIGGAVTVSTGAGTSGGHAGHQPPPPTSGAPVGDELAKTGPAVRPPTTDGTYILA